MTVYLSGGCKNGKSSLAEKTAKALCRDSRLYYLATMLPQDDEDAERIRRHVISREGMGFETVEIGRDLSRFANRLDPCGTYLLDSVTALLSNEMFPPSLPPNLNAPAQVAADLTVLCKTVKNIVFVSDFIFSDAEGYGSLTEEYRRGLAQIDRTLAAVCETVAEVCSGCVTVYKGALPL